MTDYEVVDLGGMEVTEMTPVVAGPRGRSAYEVAVADGFSGTELEWLDSLQGVDGDDGLDGASAYEVAVANGFVGTEAEWLASLAAEGGGAVESVNGQAGVVVLDAVDVGARPDTYVPTWDEVTGKPAIPDSADDIGAETPAGAQAKVDTHAADTTSVHGIADTSALATTADVSAASTADRARANHTGTQTSATIADFTEAVQDAVAALLASGSNVTLTYDDPGNTLTVSAAGADAETMRDTIGAALVGVGNVAVTGNDAADTITISTTATVNATDAALRDRSTHTGTQAASTITGLGTAATKNVPATGNASATEVVLGNDTRLSGSASALPKVAELATNVSVASTTYATILSTTFTPIGTAAVITVAGVASHSVANSLILLQVTRDGTGTTSRFMGSPSGSGLAGSQYGLTARRKFTDLTAGVTYTFNLQARVASGASGTWNCRPASFPENEELTLTVEDASPL